MQNANRIISKMHCIVIDINQFINILLRFFEVYLEIVVFKNL